MRQLLVNMVIAAVVLAMAAVAHGRTEVVHVSSGGKAQYESGRTWFIATTASEDDIDALRARLIDSGARAVNVFMPDGVIVCQMPRAQGKDALGATPGFTRRQEDALGPALVSATGRRVDWIRDAYRSADLMRLGPGTGAEHRDPPTEFKDVVIKSTPEHVREVQRMLEAHGALRSQGSAGSTTRLYNQNSEILAGNIVAQFIYPESDGSLEQETETWTTEELGRAKAASTAAMITWQDKFIPMDIRYVFWYVDRNGGGESVGGQPGRAITGYEPIRHGILNDHLWILDTVRHAFAGVAGRIDDPIAAVHAINEWRRTNHGYDWAFTAFIADSRNAENHRFLGADYTAYANLGGPYMVEPYPAGLDPNLIGEDLVFSQIVEHEVGHIFWTLDEYPGAPGGCSDRSGYLAYQNRNLIRMPPGGPSPCTVPPIDCIMNQAARSDLGSPYCEWSLGQLGVIDADDDGVPDAFQSRPIIEFAVEGPETVQTNSAVIGAKAISTAVANRNPNFGLGEAIDYAAPLREAWLSLGSSQGRVDLLAVDGRFNEIEEDLVPFRIEFGTVGKTTLTFWARNTAGLKSVGFSKDIYFIGINYRHVGVDVREQRIDFTWEVIGEDFGAEYNVYRLAPGQQKPGGLIAANVAPSGPGQLGFIPYRFSDWDIEPGRGYRYYAEGVFSLELAGSPQEYRAETEVVGETAMIPIQSGEIISKATPNPFRDGVTISVKIPENIRALNAPPGEEAPSPANVAVEVFDVAGRVVRTLRKSRDFTDVLTLRWDGRDDRSRLVPTGIYFLRVKTDETTAVRKLVLIR